MKKICLLILFSLCLLPASGITPEEDLYTQAESRYKAGNYSIALEFYNSFIQNYPLSGFIPDAQYRKAVCLFRLEQYKECLKLLENIKIRYKTTRYYSFVDFWAGLSLFRLKDYSRTVDSLNAFLVTATRTPLITQALLYKGQAELALEDYEEARTTILQLVTDYPDSEYQKEGILLLGYIYYKLKEFPSLLSLLEGINADDYTGSGREKLLYYKAEAHNALGEPRIATDLYNRLLSASPEIASVAYRRLFVARQQEQDFSRMEQLLQQAEEHFAGSYTYLMDFWLQVGVESFKQGNRELAEHLLNKVWNVRSKETIDKAVPLYLAEIQVQKKAPEQAEKILKEYLSSQNDRDGSITIRLGDINLQRGAHQEAVPYYTRFLKDFPASSRVPEVSYFLAYCYYKTGSIAEGLELADRILKDPQSGNAPGDFLKLRAYLLKKAGDPARTIAGFREYLNTNKEDIKALVVLLKLFFQQKNYPAILSETRSLFQRIPLLEKEDLSSFLMAKYLQGLSFVAGKQYEDAIDALEVINGIKAGSAGLQVIVPYAIFYRGWSYYKLRRFDEAIAAFRIINENYSSHALLPRALYFMGWSYYTNGQYDAAVTHFSRLLKGNTDRELVGKTLFFIAKAYVNLHQEDKAVTTFGEVYRQYPQSEFADDALYEHALILSRQGDVETAVKILLSLKDQYPASPLAEETVYKVGELYFRNEKYARGKDAFYAYRAQYPGGKYVDQSLYWGGLAAYNIEEYYGAVLLWEILIDKFPRSVYRADAVLKTAEIYTRDGKYPEALKYYTLLLSDHPVEAANARANQKMEEIRYLILGLDDKEAELTAKIDQTGGVKTPEGRKTLLELAQFYIFKNDERKLELAYQLLMNIIDKKAEVSTVARAHFLLGEYYFRKDNHITAGNEFLKAAVADPANRDQMAAGILKAAEMMKLAGKNKDVRDLVKKLQENFPESQWTLEGKKLLEDLE